jgi:hypothetical protein
MARHDAYCGLYCGACSSLLAFEKEQGVESALQAVVEDGEQPCPGCDPIAQHNCEFVTCNKAHGTESCAFCQEYPCSMIIKFKDDEYEHHQSVLNNLNRIKEIGLEGWLAEQREQWKCRSCGKRTQWYEKTCTACGAEIANYI